MSKKRQRAHCGLSSRNFTNQVAIANAGGIAPLVALLGLTSVCVQRSLRVHYVDCADNETNKTTIARMLVDLLNRGTSCIWQGGKRYLSFGACPPENQAAIAIAGGIPILVSLLKVDGKDFNGNEFIQNKTMKERSETSVVLREIASALWSMAQDNPVNQAAISEEGGVPSLIALLAGIPEVHADAAGLSGPRTRTP